MLFIDNVRCNVAMKQVLIFIFLFILNFGYSQNSFSGKAFKLTTDFDKENCKDLSRCDCCTSDLIFLNSNSFYYILTCEGSNYYYKGNYTTTNESLTLNYDSIQVVDAYNFESEFDENVSQYELTFERGEIGSSSFAIELCNNKVLIRTITDKTPEFGMEDTKWIRSELTELQQSEPIKMLLNN